MLAGTIFKTPHAEHITGGFSILPFSEDLPEDSISSQGTGGIQWEELLLTTRHCFCPSDEQV